MKHKTILLHSVLLAALALLLCLPGAWAAETDGEQEALWTEEELLYEEPAPEETEPSDTAPETELPADPDPETIPDTPDTPEDPAPLPETAEETVTQQAAQAAAHPVIALTYVPRYGEERRICGQVYWEDGRALKASDYRISLYLEIASVSEHYVKPTSGNPTVALGEDGSFAGNFIVPGTKDQNAVRIHVMLIPASYTPANFTSGFNATRANALDYVLVERTETSVTVSPKRTAPVLPTAYADILPVKSNKIAVNVGFHTDGTWPGNGLSDSLIRSQLNALKPYADTVRFYSAGGEIDHAYQIAHDMGFNVVGTAWLSGDQTADQKEINALIAQCNKGLVQMACVGSETLLRNDLTEAQLVKYLKQVRSKVSSDIPVTTADSIGELMDAPSVRSACDIVFVNCYPYWSGVAINGAVKDFTDAIEELQAVCGSKRVMVSETGWPTAGQTIGSAKATGANAAAYFKGVRAWSLSAKVQVVWFDGADEPWKTQSEGEAGGHWGLFTSNMVLKNCFGGVDFFRKMAGTKLTVSAQTYTGKALTPAVTVKLGTRTLQKGTDYTITYQNNTNAGKATFTVTGKGSYTGKKTGSFTIQKATVKTPAALSVAAKQTCSLNLTGGRLTYSSSNKKVATVSSKGVITGVAPGTATITVKDTGNGNYAAATKTVKVTVYQCQNPALSKVQNVSGGMRVSWGKVSGAVRYRVFYKTEDTGWTKAGETASTAFTWTGAKNGKSYTFTVRCITRDGKGYTSAYDTKGKTLLCVSAPTLSEVTSPKAGSLTAKWKKVTGVTGYQVQYSAAKGFDSGNQSVTVKGAAALSKSLTGLSKGKTYYVRVRAYRTVSGSNVYSAWSGVRSVAVKK